MERAIVYGFGSRFAKKKKAIEKLYEVVGVTGKDAPSPEDGILNYVCPQDLNNLIWDKILICSSFAKEIINYLIDELKIDKEKIIVDSMIEERPFYAQWNEDFAVLCLLKMLNIDVKEITYLELGTNHPVRFNNTYLLYRLGATGVLVEPNIEFEHLIHCIRPKDRLITKAVNITGNEKVKFYKLKYEALSTIAFDKISENATQISEGFELDKILEVDTITVNDILSEMEKLPTVLSMDVEEMDFEILQTIDFKRYRPTIIIIEMFPWGSEYQEYKEIIHYFEGVQYDYFPILGANGLFIEHSEFMKIQDTMYGKPVFTAHIEELLNKDME